MTKLLTRPQNPKVYDLMSRIDTYLVKEGFFESRSKALSAIKAGKVHMNGKLVLKPSETVLAGATIKAEPEHPWVSRGGLKLEHALRQFDVDPTGRVCLDIGASTGGFTDVLLSHGATKVYAVDVGRDQLHDRLRLNNKVISFEGSDARSLTANMFDRQPTFIVCDASFISLTKLLGIPLALMPSGSDLVTLVKPQFEVGRDNIGKGGIVKSSEVAEQYFVAVQNWVTDQGWQVLKTDLSPIKGGDGNTEYLLHAKKMAP